MSKFRVMVDETENGALALMPMMDGGIVYASNGEPLVLGIRDAVRFGVALLCAIDEWWELTTSVEEDDIDTNDVEITGDSDNDEEDDEDTEDADDDSDSEDDIQNINVFEL